MPLQPTLATKLINAQEHLTSIRDRRMAALRLSGHEPHLLGRRRRDCECDAALLAVGACVGQSEAAGVVRRSGAFWASRHRDAAVGEPVADARPSARTAARGASRRHGVLAGWGVAARVVGRRRHGGDGARAGSRGRLVGGYGAVRHAAMEWGRSALTPGSRRQAGHYRSGTPSGISASG